MTMKKIILMTAFAVLSSLSISAIERSGRGQLGFGMLYERGMELTLAYEHETRYHGAWEYFGNVYLKWDDCASCGHICPDSFWTNYNTWGIGAAYKPCILRGRNSNGNLRVGASLGADRQKVLGGVHAGYEHSYSLRDGWQLYWQVKSDLMIGGRDLFRTGVTVGFKFPIHFK